MICLIGLERSKREEVERVDENWEDKCIDALNAFDLASTWREARLILVENEKFLISDAVAKSLQTIIILEQRFGSSPLSLHLQEYQRLFQNVRVYGVDKAWKIFEPYTIKTPDREDVFLAIEDIINVSNTVEFYIILLKRQKSLTNNLALGLLLKMEAEAKKTKSKDFQTMLRLRIELLEEIIQSGFDVAYDNYYNKLEEHSTYTLEYIGELVRKFMFSESWEEARLVLNEHIKPFTSTVCEEYMRESVKNCYENGDPESAHDNELYSRLFEETAKLGIDAAWQHFITTPNLPPPPLRIQILLEEFINTPLGEKRRKCLEENKMALLSSSAVGIVRKLLSGCPDELSIQIQFTYLLKLQQEAHIEGFDRAWASYMKAHTPSAIGLADIIAASFKNNDLGIEITDDFVTGLRSAFEQNKELDSQLAIGAYLLAETWDDAKQILEQRQDVLLSDEGISGLTKHAEAAKIKGDHIELLRIQSLLLLAQTVQKLGLSEGERVYKQQVDTEVYAITMLFCAKTWNSTLPVLKEWKEVLLTDMGIGRMRRVVQEAQAEQMNEISELGVILIRFLEGAQVYGIDAAWRMFNSIL